MIRKTIIVVLTLASVSTVAIAVASHWYRADWGGCPTKHTVVIAGIVAGNIYVFQERTGDPAIIEREKRWQEDWHRRTGNPAISFERFDKSQSVRKTPHFRVKREGSKIHGPVESTFFRIPLWAISILFLTYPAIAFVRTLQSRHLRREGCCRNCGYNLTGNVSGTCPECGAEVPAP